MTCYRTQLRNDAWAVKYGNRVSSSQRDVYCEYVAEAITGKDKVVEVLVDVLPEIKEFVASKLPEPSMASIINGHGHERSKGSSGPSQHALAIPAS
jgi:hypothetical protein